MKRASVIFALVLLLSAVQVAGSEPEKAAGSPQAPIDDALQGKKTPPAKSDEEFSWSLGAGVIASPRPYKGTKARIFPIPALSLKYKRWFLDGIRGGYSFVKTENLTANLFAQVRFRGLEPEDSPFLEGMEERRKSLDAGVEVTYSRRPIGFRAGLITDTLGRSRGQEASVLAVSGIPLGRWGIILGGIGPRWLSQNRVDYYYGVRPGEATPERPAYRPSSTWNLDLNVTALINLGSKWSLVSILNREGLGSSIKNSPIVERSSAWGLITALSYNF